jgi:hypothetical protein
VRGVAPRYCPGVVFFGTAYAVMCGATVYRRFQRVARQPPKETWRDMPERLARAVQQFADDIGRLHTPLAVLVALQNVSHSALGVEVLGAWTLLRYFKDQITDWREGEKSISSSRRPAQLLARLSEAIRPARLQRANNQGAASVCPIHFCRGRTRRRWQPSQLDIRFLPQL